jgi:hypothetical protein
MKKLEVSLNILHYCIYCIHYKLHLLANKVNPFNLIHKLPFQRRRYAKLGIDIQKQIDRAFSDKRNGISMTVAGGVLFGMLFLLIVGTVHSIIRVMNLDIVFTAPYFIVFALIPFVVCYFYVFKNDKYLKYFKEFENWPKAQKRKNSYFSIGFIIAVLCLFLQALCFNSDTNSFCNLSG